MMYAVINSDGTYAGRPCDTNEAAFELASQQSGRRVYVLETDVSSSISNSLLETFENESAEEVEEMKIDLSDWEW